MKKIPLIFKRNENNPREILEEINPLCKWVFDGEGIPTRKYDGTACLVKRGKLWKRREVKKGKKLPEIFITEDFDKNTGKTFGWVSVEDAPENKWHLLAFTNKEYKDGTYELCGPKIQGNPEHLEFHRLIKHSDAEILHLGERTYQRIKEYLRCECIEGIVFHHLDGRMAKIRKADFNYN